MLHGGLLVCLLQWMLRDEGVTEESMTVENTSITTMEWEPVEDQFRLLGINNVRYFGRKRVIFINNDYKRYKIY